MPDDAHLDRFRPPAGGAPVPVEPDSHVSTGGAPRRSEDATAGDGFTPVPWTVSEAASAPATTWDEWSHTHRDRRERAALVTRIRGDRGIQGLQHAHAVAQHRSQVRRAVAATVAAAVTFGLLWFRVINARDAAIEQGLGARGFAPGGFVLLLLTVLLAVWLLRLWRAVYRARVDPLRFAPLPDSPDAPRHGAFDGTAQPPTRW